MTESPLQTEFEFTLPKGYVDEEGTVHRDGRMRLATAADEIQPLSDPRVAENASYLTIVLLSRVVIQLGSLDEVTPAVIESLFVSDLEYLQDLYARINTEEPTLSIDDEESEPSDSSADAETESEVADGDESESAVTDPSVAPDGGTEEGPRDREVGQGNSPPDSR